MWQVVYIAPSGTLGEMVKCLLDQRGFLVMLRQVGSSHTNGAAPVEVLVPRMEAEDAHDVLLDVLSAGLGRRRA